MKLFSLLSLGCTLLLWACATASISPSESQPSALTYLQPEKTPLPIQTSDNDLGPHYPPNYPEALKSSERCNNYGDMPQTDKARLHRTTTTLSIKHKRSERFTGSPRFCSGATHPNLLIVNHDQLLSFDPNHNKTHILFDHNTTWNQETTPPLTGLQSCVVNAQGEIYLTYRTPPDETAASTHPVDYTSGVYKANLNTKTLTPIRYLPHPTAQRRYAPLLSPLPTNFAYEEGYNLSLAISSQNDVYISTGMSLRKINAQNEAESLYLAYEAADEPFGVFPAMLHNNELKGIDGKRANIQSIDQLAFDDKNNLFINSEKSRSLFRLNTDTESISMNNSKGVQNFKADYYTYLGVDNGLSHYNSHHHVFLGPADALGIVTRDGCSQIIQPKGYLQSASFPSFMDITSSIDNAIYAIETETGALVQIILDPDIAEKEQWEPPQAWKDYTGLD